jgi:hypothetical protein
MTMPVRHEGALPIVMGFFIRWWPMRGPRKYAAVRAK